MVQICKTYLCAPRKLFRVDNNEVVREVPEFQRSLSRLLSRMGKGIFIPEDKHGITNLDNYVL